MSTFFFYEPRGTPTRFSNKERFRLRPGTQSHAPADREPTCISGPTSGRSGRVVDAANTTSWASNHHALPLESACQLETSPSTSSAADDCFDEAQLSDSDDSLHSLFSDFTDEWPENTDCNSDDVLAMPLQCPQNAIVSPAISHDDANPDDASPKPGEGSGFEHLKPVLDSSPSAVSHGQHARGDPGGARPPTPSNRVPPPRRFIDIYSDPADSFKTGHSDLAIVDTVQIDAGTQTDQVAAHMDAGTQTDQVTAHMDADTQTDQVDTAQIHSDRQTDQHNVDGNEMVTSEPRGVPFDGMEQTLVAHREEGRSCPVRTRESQESDSFEQQDYGVRGPQDVDSANLVGFDHGPSHHHQGLSDMVPTDSTCPHHALPHPLVNEVRHSHYLPIHGFFTVHEREGQLAYTLTFFESMTHSPLHTADGVTPSLAKDKAAEQLSTVADVAVHDNEVSPVFTPSLSVDASLQSTKDANPGQRLYISNGQKGDRFSPEDDALLVRLKGEGMPWKTIATFFPGRSEGSLQNRYCTKLKRNLPEDCQEQGREPKRVQTADYQRSDEEASWQLQRELDWIARDSTAIDNV